MPLDPGCLGRRYTAPPQRLDRQRHLQYARAVSRADRSLSDFRRPLACFASVYLLWPIVPQLFQDHGLGIDLSRLLHGEQDFEFERPAEFDEEIAPRGLISRAERRRGIDFLELSCEGHDSSGALVARSRSLFLIREAS